MRPLVAAGAVFAAALLACGESPNATRSTNLGELWLVEAESVEAIPDAGTPALALDFGPVKLGERRSRELHAFNAGADPIVVSGVRFDASSDSSYFMNPPQFPVTLAEGEAFSLSVTFVPFREGVATTKLEFAASGRTNGATGTLTGVGEE